MNRDEIDIAALRENYTRGGLERDTLHENPMQQFEDWLSTAVNSGILEANAMSLATADEQGQPSIRTVLLKGIDERGFRFFTNYQSKKASDLRCNQFSAASFLWKELERQVNVRGVVQKIPREESRSYFQSRPYASQIGAWVSEVQSQEIESRGYFAEREKMLREKYPEGAEVPLPDFWGGYIIKPSEIEFWQGRESRLHDRFRYFYENDAEWVIQRLSS